MATGYNFDDYLLQKSKMAKAKKAALPPAPKTPVVPEEGPDGTKRLYKVRYEELEKLYLGVVNERDYWMNEQEATRQTVSKLDRSLRDAQAQLSAQKAKLVDSEMVIKKVQQICKELKLPIDTNEFRTTDSALNAFFGLVFTHVRLPQEEADVLPD